MVKDPVCLMEVDERKAQNKYAYQGRTYYFCAKWCLEKFKANPVEYLSRHGEELEQ